MPEDLRAVQHPDGITGCWSGCGKAAPAFFLGGKAHSGRSEGNPTQAPTPAAPEGGAWNGTGKSIVKSIYRRNPFTTENNVRALDSGDAVCYTISVDGIR